MEGRRTYSLPPSISPQELPYVVPMIRSPSANMGTSYYKLVSVQLLPLSFAPSSHLQQTLLSRHHYESKAAEGGKRCRRVPHT